MTTILPRYPDPSPTAGTSHAQPSTPLRRPLAARLLRGNPGDPRWARPALLALLLATAVLYLWGLGASGWANAYYSAAAQAGSESWEAFFYGSFDAAGAITVDKTPASLWVTALSVRLLGLSSWSILVPQALMGVATVGMLYGCVRRWFGPAAGLLAGAVLALTPVATLMFRFNNPDALLVLLLTLGAYATIRALETASTRWLVAAATLVGFGFLTKMLQALLVVPAFALVYLLAAPTSLRRRIGQLACAGLALVASAGWWIAAVELVPASARPYIGGSQSNSILDLTLGYNGLGRLNGEETGSVGGPMGWGNSGWARLLDVANGGQIAWLLPAALILLAAGLWATRRAPRTDRTRAAFALWGGWLLVTAAVFSFMQGIFHAYYDVALAPAIGALVGMGAVTLWRRAHQPDGRWAMAALAGTVALTAAWAAVLLGRSPDWQPWLRAAVVVAGFAAAAGLLAITFAKARWLTRRVGTAAVAAGLIAVLAAPAAYSLETAATPHTGAIPSAGPPVMGAAGGPRGLPGGAPGGAGGGPDGRGFQPDGGTRQPGTPGGTPGGAPNPGGPPNGVPGGVPDGADGGPDGMPQGGPGGGQGGAGGLLRGSTPGDEMVALLERDSDAYTWIAATVAANNAAGYQLATGDPVLAIGGFNGSDPSPTLEQFQQHVHHGDIHYFIAGGGYGPQNGGSDTAEQIAAWVEQNFTATTVDGITVYDLTGGTDLTAAVA